MAYSKTTWANGDVITAAKLNNMENGIDGATSLIAAITIDGDDKTLDKTWQEIYDALAAGIPVYAQQVMEGVVAALFPIVTALNDDGYVVMVTSEVSQAIAIDTYTALTANSYPTTGSPK